MEGILTAEYPRECLQTSMVSRALERFDGGVWFSTSIDLATKSERSPGPKAAVFGAPPCCMAEGSAAGVGAVPGEAARTILAALRKLSREVGMGNRVAAAADPPPLPPGTSLDDVDMFDRTKTPGSE